MLGHRCSGHTSGENCMIGNISPIINIVGRKGSGKTHLMTAIIKRLTARGFRIAAVRHTSHNHSLDRDGTDTALFRASGAHGTALAAEQETTVFLPAATWDKKTAAIGRAFEGCHLVLMEGGLQHGLEKIEVVPEGEAPLCRDDASLRACVGQPRDMSRVPCFASDDISGICAFLETRYLKPQLSAAIMAGGKSSRLGRNKALLALGDATVIEHVIAAVSAIASPVTIITNNPQDYSHLGLAAAGDLRPGCGPLSGIHAALSLSGTEYVLIQSCDIPLIGPAHLNLLHSNYPGHDITIFKTSRFEPLCAIYRRTCLPALEELIDHGEYRIIDLFPTLDTLVLRSGDEDAFRSINTDEDYEAMLKRL
jgi:molybdenum cofactor guanylyltransferase